MNNTKENNKVFDDKIRYLIRNMRKRYKGKTDLIIGSYLYVAGQKLLKSYFNKHKKHTELNDLKERIIYDLTVFQEDLKSINCK